MNIELFEKLLNRPESDTLDFKRDQYDLKNGEDKFIKDIIAFANTKRNGDAYILIGVPEVPKNGMADKSNLCGITSHLKDSELQQKINSKTNRAIKFSYESFEYNGKEFGVIKIDKDQNKLFYLKNDFKFENKILINKHDVFVRLGSSNNIMSPDEVLDYFCFNNSPELQVVMKINGKKVNNNSFKVESIFPVITDYPDGHIDRNTDILVPPVILKKEDIINMLRSKGFWDEAKTESFNYKNEFYTKLNKIARNNIKSYLKEKFLNKIEIFVINNGGIVANNVNIKVEYKPSNTINQTFFTSPIKDEVYSIQPGKLASIDISIGAIENCNISASLEVFSDNCKPLSEEYKIEVITNEKRIKYSDLFKKI